MGLYQLEYENTCAGNLIVPDEETSFFLLKDGSIMQLTHHLDPDAELMEALFGLQEVS